MRHGDPQPVPVDALLADDPELALVTADMRAWIAAGNDQDEDDPVEQAS